MDCVLAVVQYYISEVNMKEKIKKVKGLLRHQEAIQKWHRKNGKAKNPIIQTKIAFGYAVLDFLYHKGKCVNHKGQMSSYMWFGKSSMSCCRCIEDTHNIKVQEFVNKVRKVAFDDYADWLVFTSHPSRRFSGEVNGIKYKVEEEL